MSDLDKAVKAVEDRLQEAVKTHEQQVAEHGKATAAVEAEMKTLAEDWAQAKAEQAERIKALEQRLADAPAGDSGHAKSVGEQFVESEQLAQFKSGAVGRATLETKNTLTSTQGRRSGHVDTQGAPNRPLSLLDVIPQGQTDGNAVEYSREEAGSSNNAGGKADGSALDESKLDLAQVTDPIRNVGTYLRVSKGIIEDNAALASFIDHRLMQMADAALERGIITGTGNSGTLGGFAATKRTVAFTGETGEAMQETINRMKYAVYGAEYVPDFVIVSPGDWGALERGDLAGMTGALNYLGQGLVPHLWGVPVVASPHVADDTGIVGSSTGCMLLNRSGIAVQAYEQDAANATSGLVTLVAERRCAFAVFAQRAFASCDDLTPT